MFVFWADLIGKIWLGVSLQPRYTKIKEGVTLKSIASLVLFTTIIGILVSACSSLRESASLTVTREKFAFVYTPKSYGMEYECLDSHTGKCFFVVRDSGCKLTKFYLIYRETVCGDEQQRISLSVGEKITKHLFYNQFSICASEKEFPEMPECLKTMEQLPYIKEYSFGRVTMVLLHSEPI